MPFYEKSEIRRGMYMELDAPTPAYVKRSQPRAPRYGDPPAPPDFSAVSANLDQVRQRIEKLRDDFRAARQRKP